MNPTPASRLSGWLKIIYALIFIGALYLIGSTIYIVQTTGRLKVSASDSKAGLSISRSGGQAKIIGVGTASVRLKPGTYQLSGVDNSNQGYAIVQITKGQTTATNLSVSSSVRLPAEEDIDFGSNNELLSHGLSLVQISKLKEDFFEFKPSAKKVDINYASFEPGPLDGSGIFKTTFSVKIDITSYNGSIGYSGLDDMQLSIYNPQTGALLYSSQ